MPAIDITVAWIWAVYMTLVTLVLSYYGFVVAARQDLAVEPVEADPSDTPKTDTQAAG